MSSTGSAPLEGVVPSEVTPDAVDPAEIRSAFESSRPLVRQRGARVCAALAAENPGSVRRFVDELGRALRDENPGVVQTAASALQFLADEDVDAVTPVVEHAASVADSELGGVQLAGAQVLAAVARDRPEQCASVLEPVLDGLSRSVSTGDEDSVAGYVDDSETRQTIRQHEREERKQETLARQLFSNVVVAVAEAAPSSVIDHVETVAELAADEDDVVRGAALDTLAAVGQQDPELVEPVADAVVACLDADEPVLRARAVRVLGFLDDDRHLDALRRVAETDPDDEIATFADETATFLSE